MNHVAEVEAAGAGAISKQQRERGPLFNSSKLQLQHANNRLRQGALIHKSAKGKRVHTHRRKQAVGRAAVRVRAAHASYAHCDLCAARLSAICRARVAAQHKKNSSTVPDQLDRLDHQCVATDVLLEHTNFTTESECLQQHTHQKQKVGEQSSR